MEDRNYFNLSGILHLVQNIVLLTLILERIGCILLSLVIPGVWEDGFIRGAFFILFHSVSAFNGAGFDLTGHSLIPYQDNLPLNMVFIVLILLGSLGYVVLYEVFWVRRWRRLSLHSRLVLLVTGIITVVGGSFYFFSIYSNFTTSITAKLVDSLFQAVTRTAGFVTTPVLSWTEPFIFLMVIMMFIGARPGSVGGGIKTTTIGTIVLAVWAIVRGEKQVEVFEREIAPESVSKAFTVMVMASILIMISTLVLMIVEDLPMLPVLFEVVSAMATVGLSMGITPDLSPFGQAVIGLLMFIGRIGVLTVVMVLAGREKKRYRYMKEEVLIG